MAITFETQVPVDQRPTLVFTVSGAFSESTYLQAGTKITSQHREKYPETFMCTYKGRGFNADTLRFFAPYFGDMLLFLLADGVDVYFWEYFKDASYEVYVEALLKHALSLYVDDAEAVYAKLVQDKRIAFFNEVHNVNESKDLRKTQKPLESCILVDDDSRNVSQGQEPFIRMRYKGCSQLNTVVKNSYPLENSRLGRMDFVAYDLRDKDRLFIGQYAAYVLGLYRTCVGLMRENSEVTLRAALSSLVSGHKDSWSHPDRGEWVVKGEEAIQGLMAKRKLPEPESTEEFEQFCARFFPQEMSLWTKHRLKRIFRNKKDIAAFGEVIAAFESLIFPSDMEIYNQEVMFLLLANFQTAAQLEAVLKKARFFLTKGKGTSGLLFECKSLFLTMAEVPLRQIDQLMEAAIKLSVLFTESEEEVASVRHDLLSSLQAINPDELPKIVSFIEEHAQDFDLKELSASDRGEFVEKLVKLSAEDLQQLFAFENLISFFQGFANFLNLIHLDGNALPVAQLELVDEHCQNLLVFKERYNHRLIMSFLLSFSPELLEAFIPLRASFYKEDRKNLRDILKQIAKLDVETLQKVGACKPIEYNVLPRRYGVVIKGLAALSREQAEALTAYKDVYFFPNNTTLEGGTKFVFKVIAKYPPNQIRLIGERARKINSKYALCCNIESFISTQNIPGVDMYEDKK